MEHRRKEILCVGLRVVCDLAEPAFGAVNPLWPFWVGALNTTARANVSVYAVDSTGLSRGSGAHGAGLVTLTGGELFANSNDFVRAADAIWSRASRYYLLGHWPLTDKRELHAIDVKVARKDVHLHVRRTRQVRTSDESAHSLARSPATRCCPQPFRRRRLHRREIRSR